MIFVTLTGGLGNQMFQYAYAYYLSKKYSEPISLNLAQMGKNELETRNLSLQHLNIQDLHQLPMNKQIIKNFVFMNYRKIRIKMYKLMGLDNGEIWEQMSRRGVYYCPDVYGYYPYVATRKKVKYVEGTFLAYNYVKKSPELKKIYKIATKASNENMRIIEKIEKTTSVCLHIRRGDYTAYPDLCVCSKDYYHNAVKKMNKIVPDAKFFVFSNNHKEIDWIKNHYKFLNEFNVDYVDLNNPDYEDLRLMYSCKHFIISNSTFSWWAQYLGEYKSKIVMAPETWHKGWPNSKNIFMPDWVKLPVGTDTNESFL